MELAYGMSRLLEGSIRETGVFVLRRSRARASTRDTATATASSDLKTVTQTASVPQLNQAEYSEYCGDKWQEHGISF